MKLLLIAICLFTALPCFAIGSYTKITKTGTRTVLLYSEYYPNPDAKFKGTIIFECGGTNTINEWTKNKIFFNTIKKRSGIFLYDRSGLGKSPPDLTSSINHPITAKTINTKLLQLLKARHIPKPYILVAHSYGGLFMGYFARRHPKIVKGVLLIDPTPPNSSFPPQVWNTINKMERFAAKSSTREMYQKYSYRKAKPPRTIPAAVFYHMLGFAATKAQLIALPPLPNNIPIIVLSSSFMEKIDPNKPNDWYLSQKKWLNKNPNSRIIRINSGHFIHQEHPRIVCHQLNKLITLANQ